MPASQDDARPFEQAESRPSLVSYTPTLFGRASLYAKGLSNADALSIDNSVWLVKPTGTPCNLPLRLVEPDLDDRVVGVAKARRSAKAADFRPLTRNDFVAWGKASVRARMRKLTPDERRAVARKAALARWAKKKTKRKSKLA